MVPSAPPAIAATRVLQAAPTPPCSAVTHTRALSGRKNSARHSFLSRSSGMRFPYRTRPAVKALPGRRTGPRGVSSAAGSCRSGAAACWGIVTHETGPWTTTANARDGAPCAAWPGRSTKAGRGGSRPRQSPARYMSGVRARNSLARPEMAGMLSCLWGRRGRGTSTRARRHTRARGIVLCQCCPRCVSADVAWLEVARIASFWPRGYGYGGVLVVIGHFWQLADLVCFRVLEDKRESIQMY